MNKLLFFYLDLEILYVMKILEFSGNSLEYVYNTIAIGELAALKAADTHMYVFSQVAEFQKEILQAQKLIRERKLLVLSQDKYSMKGQFWTYRMVLKKMA